RDLHSFPTRRSSDLTKIRCPAPSPSSLNCIICASCFQVFEDATNSGTKSFSLPSKENSVATHFQICPLPYQKSFAGSECYRIPRSEEHTSELQSREN